jgi:hypothetical protein
MNSMRKMNARIGGPKICGIEYMQLPASSKSAASPENFEDMK